MNPEVRGDASYWVSAKELREIGSERSKAYKYLQNAVNTLYNRSVIRTFGSNGKNVMSSVGFLRSLIEAA